MLKNQWVGMRDATFAEPAGFLSTVTVQAEAANGPNRGPSPPSHVCLARSAFRPHFRQIRGGPCQIECGNLFFPDELRRATGPPMIQYAPTKRIQSFHPPRRTLMGPGPTEIHPRVLTTMSQPAIGYLDPVFIEMMEELKALLRYAYRTRNPLTFPLSGPGSVGMEYCFVNLVSPGDKVIVCRNGVFGGRMVENVVRMGGVPVVVDDEWGQPADPQKLSDALDRNPDARVVAFVHAETSTGCMSDAKVLTDLAHRHDAMAIVDAVTSLAGIPVRVDEWGVDAIYSGSQKCLSCTPGLSPVSFSERVVDYVKGRKDKIHSWFMDMNLLLGYWATGLLGIDRAYLPPHGADQFAFRAP